MDTNQSRATALHTDLYQRASSDLIALKSILPQEAVVSLAREVLGRLANRVAEPSTRSDVIMNLSEALVTADPRSAAKLIDAQYQAGVAVEALYLGFLAPAARQLGDWWDADKISFADVTVGIGRIYGIMRAIGSRMPRPTMPDEKAALIACVPGDTHTLGAKMAAELLREQGWTIDLALALDHDALVERIVASGHLVLAFSGAGEHALPALTRLVVATRVQQPHASILVSGNVLNEAGDRVALLGVDGMSANFADAARLLDTMWEGASAQIT